MLHKTRTTGMVIITIILIIIIMTQHELLWLWQTAASHCKQAFYESTLFELRETQSKCHFASWHLLGKTWQILMEAKPWTIWIWDSLHNSSDLPICYLTEKNNVTTYNTQFCGVLSKIIKTVLNSQLLILVHAISHINLAEILLQQC